jgi:tRNA-specific 2-thiouridylase
MGSRGAVVVGLSGGVDSAVAALRLREAGWEVRGLFMKNWEEDDTPERCAAAADLEQARAVADRLGIPLETVNFSAEYWDRVFAHFLAEHRAARTPNPDVLCNSEIKFRAFLDHALARGAACMATGHYARLSRGGSRWRLLVAADAGKDQTYFLHRLGQAQLARCLFPLGDLHKAEVRRIARAAGLPNHDRKDSTGICFIGERRFREFLMRYLPARPGPIETPEGTRLGRHCGLAFYTVGQRQGLGIGGRAGGTGAPWFVAAKDRERNALVAVQGHDHPMLMAGALEAGEMSWVAGLPPDSPSAGLRARIRHGQPPQECRGVALADGRWRVEFHRPQRAVAPGQSVVLYRGDECLGGGVIERAVAGSGFPGTDGSCHNYPP